MSSFRVEIAVDGEGGESRTLTISDEPGTTIEEQAHAEAQRLWPGQEHLVVITGEFDDKGVLKTSDSMESAARPVWAPKEFAPQKPSVVQPTSSQVSGKDKVRQLIKERERIQQELENLTKTCDHKWLESRILPDGAYQRECAECGLAQTTRDTEVRLVPKWEDTHGQMEL